ncbi:MAG: flavodoxin domain-containing protein [Oscillospiraceae bacterium]|jgi:menaquinone-dependent protoporphyrinogen IX oxidase|nr:flavodoxin domain-containing protein [Oscillospiraceae bacterium]
MNGIILYKSKYGATKKYAEWLRDTTGFDIIETNKATVAQVKNYDVIVLGGGIYASGISGLSFLRKNMDELAGKRLAVFCVGGSPFEQAAFEEMYAHNFKGNLSGVKCFYCRGAFDMEVMNFADKTLCKMLKKTLEKKDPATYEPSQAALIAVIGQNGDWTDKEYLQPLIEYLK